VRHVFRYLVHEDPTPGRELVLGTEDSRHLVRVVRRQPGDLVEVIAPSGNLWPCEVVSTGNPAVVRVTGPMRPAPPIAPLTLWVGLAEAGRLEFVAEKATELGVQRVGVMVTDRATRVPDADAWARREARMQRVAISAARQSGRGVRPVPMGLVAFAHVLATTTPGQGIILDPRADTSLAQVLDRRADGEPLTVLVGPDTGFTDAEVDAACAIGMTSAHMGAGMLRAETAAIAAATLALHSLGALA